MKWLAIIVGTAVGLYSLYLLGFPSDSYRFRITLEVDAADNGLADFNRLGMFAPNAIGETKRSSESHERTRRLAS